MCEALPWRLLKTRSAPAVLWAGLACCILVFASAPALAQGRTDEYQIKAAFLYNFSKFAEWPDEAQSTSAPFVIGIVGEDPFGPALDNLVQGKNWNGRRIAVKRLDAKGNFHGCHILYISNSERTEVPRILAAVKGEHVLTVGEFDRFLRQGGSIAFDIEDDRIRITINLIAAEASGIKLSSKLLGLARVMTSSREAVGR